MTVLLLVDEKQDTVYSNFAVHLFQFLHIEFSTFLNFLHDNTIRSSCHRTQIVCNIICVYFHMMENNTNNRDGFDKIWDWYSGERRTRCAALIATKSHPNPISVALILHNISISVSECFVALVTALSVHRLLLMFVCSFIVLLLLLLFFHRIRLLARLYFRCSSFCHFMSPCIHFLAHKATHPNSNTVSPKRNK